MKLKNQAYWWESYDSEDMYGQPLTMNIETSESFDFNCGFVKLKERHRIKAGSFRWSLEEVNNAS